MFDAATQPFQYALQARAGTDALAALLRTELELRPDTTIVSLDGRSAYDCISRRAFLTKLREVAPALVPFVRLFCGQPSTYCWWDDAGRLREVRQGEGCEQGDPLAPALFALGQHDALVGAAATLQPHEELAAFLDDVYVVTTAPGARRALDTVTGAIAAHCGIAANLGKTRVFNFAGEPAPGNIAALGDGVWRSDKATHERGLVVLGTPIGHSDFVRTWSQNRVATERVFLDMLPRVPDLQCAWLLLAMCAPSQSHPPHCTAHPGRTLCRGARRSLVGHAAPVLGWLAARWSRVCAGCRGGRGIICAHKSGSSVHTGFPHLLRHALWIICAHKVSVIWIICTHTVGGGDW